MNTYTADYSSSLFIMKNWVISNIATYQNHLKEILQTGNLQMSMYHYFAAKRNTQLSLILTLPPDQLQQHIGNYSQVKD